MDYFPWCDEEDDESLAWVWDEPRELRAGGNSWRLGEGEAVASWFPAGVEFRLAGDKGPRIADSLPNTLSRLFVSERLKAYLEQESGCSIEFLPIRLRDGRGKPVAAPYFIANPLGSIACLDRERSDFIINEITKDRVRKFRRLALDEHRIPEGTRLFRLGEMTRLVIVSRPFAEAIQAAGFNGMRFVPMPDYGAEWRPWDWKG